jgi:hypothetical protein
MDQILQTPNSSAEAPSPATLLANPSTHPLAPDSYMPVLCTSQSTEVTNSNGGDGSSWWVQMGLEESGKNYLKNGEH